jgi:serine/threonine protein kinase
MIRWKSITILIVNHSTLLSANILVNQNCDIRICDFGMARGHIDDHNHESWNLTQYVSTRWYRAPEIMLSRNSYNKSSKRPLCSLWNGIVIVMT